MITLVLGGARQGKSEVAERLIAGPGPAGDLRGDRAVATDADMAARIAAHRDRRPAAWRTVEAAADLAEKLATRRRPGPGGLARDVGGRRTRSRRSTPAALCRALRRADGDTVVVSDEVGPRRAPVRPRSAGGSGTSLGEVNQSVPRWPTRCCWSSPAGCSDARRDRSGERGAGQAVAFLTPLGGAGGPTPAALDWFPGGGRRHGPGCSAGCGGGPAGSGRRRSPPPSSWPPTWRSPGCSTSTAWSTRPTGCCPTSSASPAPGRHGRAGHRRLRRRGRRGRHAGPLRGPGRHPPGAPLLAGVVVRVPDRHGGDGAHPALRPGRRPAAWPPPSSAPGPPVAG